MLDLSKVPVVDSGVTMYSFNAIDKTRYIKLKDDVFRSEVYFPESKFNKCFEIFKNILEDKEKYADYITDSRGRKWFRPREIDDSFTGSDYFVLDRVPIYIEMFKHINKYKVCLDRDSLMSQNICVLNAVNNKIKKRKRLNKIDGLPYLNL